MRRMLLGADTVTDWLAALASCVSAGTAVVALYGVGPYKKTLSLFH